MNNQIIDNFFAPDIRIDVTGANSKILASKPLTTKGKRYLHTESIVGKSFDEINTENLTFEVVNIDED